MPEIAWSGDVLTVDGVSSPPLSGPAGPAPATSWSGTSLIVGDNPPVNLQGPAGARGPVGSPGAVATASDFLLVGPGRPDTPASTGGVITGSEPVGCEFRSTDGAGVGAWVWRKRPTGWVVTDGDTGWRVIDGKLANGEVTKLQTRRVGQAVHWMHGMTASFRLWSIKQANGPLYRQKIVDNGIPGFQPQERVQAIIWEANDGEQLGLISITYPGDGGYIAYSASKSSRGACFSLSAVTNEPWPTTLPGSPA